MADDFIIPDSPLSRGIEAARKGNMGHLRVGAASLLAEKGKLPEGFDDKDLIAIFEFLKAIGVGVDVFASKVLPYVVLAKAGVDLINGYLEVYSADRRESTLEFPFPYPSEIEPGAVTLLKLAAQVKKQVRGLDFLDNEDAIEQLVVSFQSVAPDGRPRPVDTDTVVTVTAIGLLQDKLELVFRAGGSGTGDAVPGSELSRSDTAGTELERVGAFHRSGTTEWKIDLGPGDNQVEYGLNGLSLALVVDVLCVVRLPDGTAFPMKTVAEDWGLSF